MFLEETLEGALSSQAVYEALYDGNNTPHLSDFATVMQAKPGAPELFTRQGIKRGWCASCWRCS
jgi:hypothetical protein